MRSLTAELLILLVFGFSACSPVPPGKTIVDTVAPAEVAATELTSEPADQTETGASIPQEIEDAETQAGYKIHSLPSAVNGYLFDSVTVDSGSQIVCIHYKTSDPYYLTELYLMQGPLTASMQPREYQGIEPVAETVAIGRADEPGRLTSGVLPPEDACADNKEWPRYILSWVFDDRQFLLYGSVDVPPGGPGLTRLEMLRLAENITGVPTHPTDELNPDNLRSLADAEKLSGLDILEPAYLPEGVSFLYATYQADTVPMITQYYKFIHPQYGDMGRFFQITQMPLSGDTPAGLTCADPSKPDCELLDIKGTPVLYHRQESGPESFNWYGNGFALSLLRMAGEPDHVYKDELVKVIESIH